MPSILTLEQIFEYLVDLNNYRDRTSGICHACKELCPEKYINYINWMKDKFKTWEHFSGCVLFPVPSSDDNPTRKYRDSRDKWNQSTEYGRLRLDLCKYLLEEAKKENL